MSSDGNASASTPGSLDPVGACVLWFAGVGWEGVPGTDRRITAAFDRPVIWVDMPRTPLTGGRIVPAPWGGIEVMRQDPPLIRLTPATFPLSARPPMRYAASSLKRSQVRAALRRLRATPDTVVYTYLDDSTKKWGGDAVEVLYGTDDYVSGASLLGYPRSWLERAERIALQRADVILTVTEDLATRWRRLGSIASVLPNGCTPLRFSELNAYDSAHETTQQQPPVVGLIGQLSARIEMDYLESLAQSAVKLKLIGPKDPDWESERFGQLIARPNVEYVGEVPPESLPDRLQTIDVGITPYALSDFNKASFPLKTLEYLGAGVPVVSSDLPASRWLAGDMTKWLGRVSVDEHLALVDSPADMAAACRRLALCRNRDLDHERWRFASRHSWSARVSTLEFKVAEYRRTAGREASGGR